MHNLEGFGFCSDCLSLKDSLNYTSSAFRGPKPCFHHHLCCQALTPVSGPQGHILESSCPGEWQQTAVAAPLQDGNPLAYKQERRTSTIFPSHSPLAINNCFIFAAFVLLVCKNPNNDVVSDKKRHKKQRRSFPDSSQRLLCHTVVQRNSVLMGPVTSEGDETWKYCYFIFVTHKK